MSNLLLVVSSPRMRVTEKTTNTTMETGMTEDDTSGRETDNNPLTYIMTTPNLDAIWHHLGESLTGFTVSIKYQKGRDNAVADALSHVTSKLDTEALRTILDRVNVGTAGRADVHDLTVAEADKRRP